jgi:MFS family permease
MPKLTFKHTKAACYAGYVSQAIVNNLAPLLFITFGREYGIGLGRIAALISINFTIQILVDMLAAVFVDRIGWRVCVVAAHLFSGLGLVGMSILPDLTPDPFVGLAIACGTYALGGGLIEVIISPIVEACPSDNKAAAMALMHSSYCWGQAGVIALSTLWFFIFGVDSWRTLALVWALIPLADAAFFCFVPIRTLAEEGRSTVNIGGLFKIGRFWVLLLLMTCAGASELAMSQWASAFAEAGLGVTKAVGDLAGPCAFAIFMGISRTLFAAFGSRLELRSVIATSSLICVCGYALAAFAPNPAISLAGCGIIGFSVGVMWPGTYSVASRIIPGGGASMFSMLALAGDLGCIFGPGVVSVVSGGSADMSSGLAVAGLFPLIIAAALFTMVAIDKKKKDS